MSPSFNSKSSLQLLLPNFSCCYGSTALQSNFSLHPSKTCLLCIFVSATLTSCTVNCCSGSCDAAPLHQSTDVRCSCDGQCLWFSTLCPGFPLLLAATYVGCCSLLHYFFQLLFLFPVQLLGTLFVVFYIPKSRPCQILGSFLN